MSLLLSMVASHKKDGKTVFSGADAFKLYDTFGFPLDLSEDVIIENGMTVDIDGFDAEMENQRTKARTAREKTGYMGGADSDFAGLDLPETVFVGYDTLECEAKVLYAKDNLVVVDKTPFYAESGGQLGDIGMVDDCNVTDCIKAANGLFVHITDGEFSTGDMVKLSVDKANRNVRKAQPFGGAFAAICASFCAWQSCGTGRLVCFGRPPALRLHAFFTGDEGTARSG
jgi:alanyl-tRNA synthetase